jgi:PmbA protein
LPEGFGTAKIDDEGVPKQKIPIIAKGVLSNILYDNYTAKREKSESTGNASRQSDVTSPYANQPAIRPSNLILMPEKGNVTELVSEIKEGVLVKGSLIGAFHSNVITGDFSVTAETAFKIENGKVAFPLKPCTVAGNLYEALNHVIAIGNDSKNVANVVCPSIVIDNIVVAT